MQDERLPLMASLIAVGSGVVWSFGAVMSREADGVDAFQYLIWRSLGIIVVIEVMHALRNAPRTRRVPGGPGGYRPMVLTAWTSDWWMVGANLGLLVASFSFVYAVKTTTPANAAFLGSLTPLVTVVFNRFLGEKLARSTIVAIVVALCGLVLTVYGDLEAGNMLGNAAALLACFGFALYTISVRSNQDRDWSPSMPGYAILMVVLCGAITLANGKALIPMTVFAQAEMVFVPVWAFLVLGNRPTALTIMGGVVIFAAVVGKAWFDSRQPGHELDEHLVTPDVPLM